MAEARHRVLVLWRHRVGAGREQLLHAELRRDELGDLRERKPGSRIAEQGFVTLVAYLGDHGRGVVEAPQAQGVPGFDRQLLYGDDGQGFASALGFEVARRGVDPVLGIRLHHQLAASDGEGAS